MLVRMIASLPSAAPEGAAKSTCHPGPALSRLWIYTNYDCNLTCSYCVAESSPRALRRALDLATVERLVDEAAALGCERVFFTGGEPFLHHEIYDMLACATARMDTVVLTNGLMLGGQRLERLVAVASERLVVQVSLDGAAPEQHDAYRGAGTWARTVAAIKRLQAAKLHVRLATTVTPANAAFLDDLAAFRRALGIADDEHVIRPLTRRGFAREGIDVSVADLVPEVTVTAEGVFWHPLASPGSTDMQVSREILPLAAAVACVRQQVDAIQRPDAGQPRTVT